MAEYGRVGLARDQREQATCSTCGRSYDSDDIQGTHPYRHPVNGPLPTKAQQEESKESKSLDREEQVKSLPSDPLLRHILIEKGIITATDITEAEQKLAASGILISER